ncbi:MAG: U32 family peptidase [Rubrivivax sp.]|nr:U32 family peptidase [Rubrivivax sp.]
MTADPQPRRFGLTVGPLQYWWPRDQTMAFYAEVAEDPAADTVVLGEVVCSRRHEFKTEDWIALARDLAGAGKTVVLATMPLISTEAELRTMRRLCEQDEFAVEAGDASALAVLAVQHEARSGRPAFVIGPHVNVYSRAALAEVAPLGAGTWVPPLELSLDAVGQINPAADPVPGTAGPVVTEAFAFGRLPLAFSARCFTARHHRLKKDECDFRCRDDADGLLLATSEGEPFLVLNGVQTQSAALHCLLGDGPALAAAGVRRLRLSPCSRGFMQALACFDAVLNQGAPAREAIAQLRAAGLPGALVDGFAHHRPGRTALAA